MKYWAIGIRGDPTHLLRDNYLNQNGEAVNGILFFKNKSNAEGECESMNRLRKSMKLAECYSVVRVEEEECGTYGKIIDGKQG